MRRWITATVVTGIVVATVLVARMRERTPDAVFAQQHPEVAEARAQVLARGDTMRAWSAALARAQTLAIAASVTRGPQPFVLETRGAISAGTRAAFLQLIERELQAIGTPKVPLRVLLVADSNASFSSYSGWYLRPARLGEPCIVMIRIRESRSQTFAPRTGDRRLGVCGLYARHGMPGPGIAAWLDETRAISAAGDSSASWDREAPTQRQVAWGGVSRLSGGMMLEAAAPLACAAGRGDACHIALLNPVNDTRRRVSLPVAQEPRLSSAYPFELRDYPGDVTATLRASMGAERFARWWQSALPPAQAYEAVTGEAFETWAMSYMRRYVGERNSGPLRAGLPLALGLLLVAGLSGWAVLRAPRARS
ncbi:hypothetical protein Strain138_001961 [Pseudogemmatithrix spongiicola]|uniref:Uncharacterized protein n=1 Tax=Pseudogemmatithrix spongiicola TaxID=3062599 RepID=A0AA49JVL8_9BACT|nr:hypothetical protein Strain138_001961 [Gemmatimonadaceae bacterium 'strain 138']WKW15569.1 hypothetical protein Strain318_001960 [Gemmatimonadaceae bacterium 'strain 318']